MKKMILSALMLTLAALGRAQVTPEAAGAATAHPRATAETNAEAAEAAGRSASAAESATSRSEWLPSFESVAVNAPVDIVFIRVPDTEAPQIRYDTKGSYTTKFVAEVRDKVLHIREKSDLRRPERTSVEVRYNTLKALSLTDAAATVEGVLTATMLDLNVGARSSLVAKLDVKDLSMELSGESSATITGTVRYLSLTASTGKADLLGTECMSARVYAQSKAEVLLDVGERLEARTTTGAAIRYKGDPAIIRTEKKFLAGEIAPLE